MEALAEAREYQAEDDVLHQKEARAAELRRLRAAAVADSAAAVATREAQRVSQARDRLQFLVQMDGARQNLLSGIEGNAFIVRCISSCRTGHRLSRQQRQHSRSQLRVCNPLSVHSVASAESLMSPRNQSSSVNPFPLQSAAVHGHGQLCHACAPVCAW